MMINSSHWPLVDSATGRGAVLAPISIKEQSWRTRLVPPRQWLSSESLACIGGGCTGCRRARDLRKCTIWWMNHDCFLKMAAKFEYISWYTLLAKSLICVTNWADFTYEKGLSTFSTSFRGNNGLFVPKIPISTKVYQEVPNSAKKCQKVPIKCLKSALRY